MFQPVGERSQSKGYNCLKLHNILLKIRNTRFHQLGEKALLTHEGRISLMGAGWEFFNPYMKLHDAGKTHMRFRQAD